VVKKSAIAGGTGGFWKDSSALPCMCRFFFPQDGIWSLVAGGAATPVAAERGGAGRGAGGL